MKYTRLALGELITELQYYRHRYGNVPVEVYDATTWETLQFLALEYSETPGSVLLIASDSEE